MVRRSSVLVACLVVGCTPPAVPVAAPSMAPSTAPSGVPSTVPSAAPSAMPSASPTPRAATGWQVTTLAGDAPFSAADAPLDQASLIKPMGLARSAAGDVYVVDQDNHVVLRLGVDGRATHVAGTGTAGFADGPGAQAAFNRPWAIALDATGGLLVADAHNQRLRRIDLRAPGFPVSTVAQLPGFVADVAVGPEGQVVAAADGKLVAIAPGGATSPWPGAPTVTDAASSRFQGGLAFGPDGALYAADHWGDAIWRIPDRSPGAIWAGGLLSTLDERLEGPKSEVNLGRPDGLAFGPSGALYVASRDMRIRRIGPDGRVTLHAGAGTYGWQAGSAAEAQFSGLRGLAVGPDDVLWVANSDAGLVRKVAGGQVTPFAGGLGRFADGARGLFARPKALAAGPDGTLYVGDGGNRLVRAIAPDGRVRTVAGAPGYNDPWDRELPDGPLGTARFGNPTGLVRLADGSLLVADGEARRLRKVAPDGTVSPFAGDPLDTPHYGGFGGLALGPDGTAFVAEPGEQCVRAIGPDGKWRILAGLGPLGHDGEGAFVDGPKDVAQFFGPSALALLPGGDLLVADGYNRRIRRVTPAGTVSTLQAGLADPNGVAIDAGGTVFVADQYQVRMIDPQGRMSTIAGTDQEGLADGPGAEARFRTLGQVAVLPDGRVAVADPYNHRIRLLSR